MHLGQPRNSGFVKVRSVKIGMFSSSTAARRQIEISTKLEKEEVKHSVEDLVVTSSSLDVAIDLRQDDVVVNKDTPRLVKTDEQDGKMSLAAENDDRTIIQ